MYSGLETALTSGSTKVRGSRLTTPPESVSGATSRGSKATWRSNRGETPAASAGSEPSGAVTPRPRPELSKTATASTGDPSEASVTRMPAAATRAADDTRARRSGLRYDISAVCFSIIVFEHCKVTDFNRDRHNKMSPESARFRARRLRTSGIQGDVARSEGVGESGYFFLDLRLLGACMNWMCTLTQRFSLALRPRVEGSSTRPMPGVSMPVGSKVCTV